jgi:hypothetical protein
VPHHFKQPLGNIAEHGNVGIGIAFKFDQHILVCWQGSFPVIHAKTVHEGIVNI